MTPSAHLSAITELLAQCESYWADGINKPADALVAEFLLRIPPTESRDALFGSPQGATTI
jgi:hypothetical protein